MLPIDWTVCSAVSKYFEDQAKEQWLQERAIRDVIKDSIKSYLEKNCLEVATIKPVDAQIVELEKQIRYWKDEWTKQWKELACARVVIDRLKKNALLDNSEIQILLTKVQEPDFDDNMVTFSEIHR